MTKLSNLPIFKIDDCGGIPFNVPGNGEVKVITQVSCHENYQNSGKFPSSVLKTTYKPMYITEDEFDTYGRDFMCEMDNGALCTYRLKILSHTDL